MSKCIECKTKKATRPDGQCESCYRKLCNILGYSSDADTAQRLANGTANNKEGSSQFCIRTTQRGYGKLPTTAGWSER